MSTTAKPTTTTTISRTVRSKTTRSGSQDNVALTSVGIDIGSAGTQVIFSKVHLRRLGEELTSRYFVVARETLFRSPVALTPYQSEKRIDDGGAAARSSRGPIATPGSSPRTSTPAW